MMGDEAIYVAASGALVQEARLEVLSNNLANINTIGFKEDRAVFSNYLPGDQVRITSTDPELEFTGDPETLFPYLQSSTQVQFEGTQTSFEQGQLKMTGNPLDFAVSGNGFFCVEDVDGTTKYTRNGTFSLNEKGNLVTQNGLIVLGRNGNEITLEGSDFSVDERGNISADGVHTDTLKIVDFDKPYSLIKAGDTLFSPVNDTVSEITPEGFNIRQGFTELSNVNPIKIMTEMIEVHRAFESYQKIMRTLDETVSESLNKIGSPV